MILGVGLATFGAGFIQGPPHLTWGVAEFITVFCALLFALHILFTQHITTRRDPIAVSTTSFIVVTLCSAITVFLLGDGTNMEQWNLIFSDGVSAIFTSNSGSYNLCFRTSVGNSIWASLGDGGVEYLDSNRRRSIVHW